MKKGCENICIWHIDIVRESWYYNSYTLLWWMMWRRPSFVSLKQSLSVAVRYKPKPPLALRTSLCSLSPEVSPGAVDVDCGGRGDGMSMAEAKKLMRLVNVAELKMELLAGGKEAMGYLELLKTCESAGVAKSQEEAAAFARVLDEAGVVLIFRDKVYLHPDKVVDLVRRAVPQALTSEDISGMDELKRLQDKKEEIDRLAHKQVRCILWSGLGLAVIQVGLFFRLTFWEFSWDIMEPVTFFTTSTGIVIGYAYFLYTSRDPTYQDLMKSLFLSRQRKLIKKHNFDVKRFMELQKECRCPLDTPGFSKNR